jgi:hypothetical protein
VLLYASMRLYTVRQRGTGVAASNRVSGYGTVENE